MGTRRSILLLYFLGNGYLSMVVVHSMVKGRGLYPLFFVILFRLLQALGSNNIIPLLLDRPDAVYQDVVLLRLLGDELPS